LKKESAIAPSRVTHSFSKQRRKTPPFGVSKEKKSGLRKDCSFSRAFSPTLRILAEKTLGQRLAGQSLAGEQQETLARLFLVNGITVAVPCADKVLPRGSPKNCFNTSFQPNSPITFLRAWTNPRLKLSPWMAMTPALAPYPRCTKRVHDLLRGAGGFVKCRREPPTGRFEYRSGECEAVDVWENQRVFDKSGAFFNKGVLAMSPISMAGSISADPAANGRYVKDIFDHSNHRASFEHRLAREFASSLGRAALAQVSI